MLLNPDATVETLRLQDGRVCLVNDEMLLEPDSLVQFAATQRNAFHAVDFNFYPGVRRALQHALQAQFDLIDRAVVQSVTDS